MRHGISGLEGSTDPSDPPAWVGDIPPHEDPDRGFMAINYRRDPEHAGEVELWTNRGDVVEQYLVIEGVLEALAHILVSGGYVRDESTGPGGWRKE